MGWSVVWCGVVGSVLATGGDYLYKLPRDFCKPGRRSSHISTDRPLQKPVYITAVLYEWSFILVLCCSCLRGMMPSWCSFEHADLGWEVH